MRKAPARYDVAKKRKIAEPAYLRTHFAQSSPQQCNKTSAQLIDALVEAAARAPDATVHAKDINKAAIRKARHEHCLIQARLAGTSGAWQ
jgi:type II secretory pathway component PulM